METSCFSRMKTIVPPAYPVAICVGLPKWYKGAALQELAPTRRMLKMSHEEYEPLMRGILAELDPAAIAAQLGSGAVLLCWEKPFLRCHRRMVAEWLEDALGVVIPELGYSRSATISYAAIHDKPTIPKSMTMPLQLHLL